MPNICAPLDESSQEISCKVQGGDPEFEAQDRDASFAPSLYGQPPLNILEVIITVMSVMAITGNVGLLSLILASRRLPAALFGLMSSLICSDLLIAGSVMSLIPKQIRHNGWLQTKEMCCVVGFMASLANVSAMLGLVAIAQDRYHFIMHCLVYPRHAKPCRITLMVFGIWLTAALGSCPPLLGWGTYEYLPEAFTCVTMWSASLSYSIAFWVSLYLAPAFAMFYTYGRLLRVAHLHAQKIRDIRAQILANPARRPDCSNLVMELENPHLQVETTSEIKNSPAIPLPANFPAKGSVGGVMCSTRCVQLKFMFIMILRMVCSLPCMVVCMLKEWVVIPHCVIIITVWLPFLLAIVNPFAYLSVSRNLQEVLKEKWHRLRRCLRCTASTSHSEFT
uniref:melatonin receptor type 1B-A-like n=1 Tax=Myxine glutinosa TaxID=7769 RepID=UPI00358E5312